ncbi:hypothetical protein DFP72DRAFT_850364 [Ephemerocybe angulata]|uniref:Uncharacterized protein n=1 Tax=Ephemerocybe angulata TaxID=980116 RepID=A0A8H6M2B3_9AGAR|nr:hypothetical protein DFP72DRAFT_850364 [Tulosesus angulatus]
MALPGNDGSMQEQIYTLVGFWLNAMFYGIYLVLFIAAISVSLKSKRQGWAFSNVLFWSMIYMFVLITVYASYARVITTPPVAYYHDISQWDNYMFGLIVTLLTWHADFLVIYRCFIIWGRNVWVITVPIMIFIISLVINTMFLTWAANPNAIPEKAALTILDMIYPINLSQNILTTGLIAYRIYSQHRRSQNAGVFRNSRGRINLLTILRIVIESAAIFTVQQFILLILLLVKSPGQVIFHGTTVPSIGIVFVLMALRTHFAKSASELDTKSGRPYMSYMTRASGHHGPTGSIAVVTTTTRTIDGDVVPMHNLEGSNARDVESNTKGPTDSYEIFESAKRGMV